MHLTPETVSVLFGDEYKLTVDRPLFQDAGSVYAERVDVSGPKSVIRNFALLGPLRKDVQVEISLSDAKALGLNPPIRISGDVKDSAPITLIGPAGRLELNQGAIIAKRHIHMSKADAEKHGYFDGEIVQVKVTGERALIWDEVVVRVRNNDLPASSMHVDFDEVNAAVLQRNAVGEVIKKKAGGEGQYGQNSL